jgi:PAS domain S-box-containing protein
MKGLPRKRSPLTLTRSLSFAVAFGISAVGGLGWVSGSLILSQFNPKFVPIAPLAILSFCLLSASGFLYTWGPKHSWLRIMAGIGTFLVVALNLAALRHFLNWTTFDLEKFMFSNRETIMGYWAVQISPLASMFLLLASLSLFSLIITPRIGRSFTALIGIFIASGGLVMTVGYVYNAPLLYESWVRPVAFPAAIAFISLGIGIWASAGPDCWPMRFLIEDSTMARLLKIFVPVTSLIVVFLGWLDTNVVPTFKDRALAGSFGLLVSLIVVVVVISRVSRKIGGEVDQSMEHLEELVEERTREISESERRFKELAELSPGIVFETSGNGNFTFMNRFGFSSTSYTREDIDRGLNMLQIHAPEDRDEIREHLQLVMTGTGLDPHEHTMMRKDGTTFPVIMHSAPLIREGKIIGIRGIAIDITERKRIENELIKSQRLATIGETAAMVGHDLRNPLQGIMSATGVLKKKLESTSDTRTKQMLLTIEKGIEYSNKIISDLLDYARETHLEIKESDPKSLIAETLEMVRNPANVRVVNSTENIPKIMIDKDKIKRVFANVIGNAFEAMPEGGTLTIANRQFNGNVEITFSDTGVGMAKETIEQIWNPLFTTKSKGIGLGLPICKRIVEAHKGVISVESTPEKGSIFIIRIPIKGR